jgi:1-Cys peroxiredoxin 6
MTPQLTPDVSFPLLSPAAFTPVCTTELSTVAQYQPEFQKRDVKLLGLSTDSLENQAFFDWLKDVEAYAKTKIEFPIVCDPSRTVSDRLNMLDLDNLNDDGNPQNARAIHVIRPDKKVGSS